MGQGIFSQCTNNSGYAFTGTPIDHQCMYDIHNLSSLPTGYSSYYTEMKNSGECYFKSSYLAVGFAFPSATPNQYQFVLGFCSMGATLSQRGPYLETKLTLDHNDFYLWFLPGGFQVGLNVENCGDQLCIKWTVDNPYEKSDAGPASAPFSLVVPKDGSDYQGDPKKR